MPCATCRPFAMDDEALASVPLRARLGKHPVLEGLPVLTDDLQFLVGGAL